jgi:hypothetical protein
MVTVTGKVLRILPFKEVNVADEAKKVVDLIIADERDYMRVSFWDAKAERVLNGDVKVGDVLKIENARVPKSLEGRGKRANVGTYARITKQAKDIAALTRAQSVNLMVLAVARPEQGRVCIAGIDEKGDWIRPQGIYEDDIFDYNSREQFKNLSITKLYLDTWHGRRSRKEDRFFVYSEGATGELSEGEKREFLERNVDSSVDEVFKQGRSLGLIKPRILHVYEERTGTKGKRHEHYIFFNLKDATGRIYRRWSCRCNDFYKAWNDLKTKHRWTCGWKMLRYLRKNDTYLTIGLTYTNYGIEKLEYGAYPMIVGVHVVPARSS